MIFRRNYLYFALILTLAASLFASPTFGAPKLAKWNPNIIIKPRQLLKLLSGKSAEKPLILQVGFQFLYEGGHIDGAKWAGPASRPDGIRRLRAALKNIPKDTSIVIYCGCCPWAECPNVRPAYTTLKELGFKKVKTLYIPINFEQDWIKKGYPVAKGNNP